MVCDVLVVRGVLQMCSRFMCVSQMCVWVTKSARASHILVGGLPLLFDKRLLTLPPPLFSSSSLPPPSLQRRRRLHMSPAPRLESSP
jgi:hypothetical protein